MTKPQPDRRETGTFHDHALGDVGPGGRFSRLTPTSVTAATPGPKYPAGPNWSHDPTGPEPVLGFPIDQQEAVGTFAEIQNSLGEPVSSSGAALGDAATTEQGQLAASPSNQTARLQRSDSSLLPASVVETPSPSQNSKED
jgi:hypothetical protein